jgi:hypothetical protein
MMKVRYTFTVYADSSVEHDGFVDLSKDEAIKHMKKLLTTKCDFSDVDFELMSTEFVED